MRIFAPDLVKRGDMLQRKWAKRSLFLLMTSVMSMATLTVAAQDEFPQLTNLPSLYINTSDGRSISSKTTYKTCTLVYRDGDSLAIYENTNVRGRGNSTWDCSDKKPYRLKFAESQKFLGKGFAKNKSWVLLANAGDKSMIRNALAYELGRFVGLPFCPAARFVDLYLNGSYRGTYQISDHVNVDSKRVEVDEETGFLLEFAQSKDKSEEPRFAGEYGYISIKNPDEEVLTDVDKQYVEDFFDDARSKLMNNSSLIYADPRRGYRAKVDTTTLINWYVAAEVTGNWDAMYSVYTYMERDGKLFFGPLWDIDLGWNNNHEADLLKELVGEKTVTPSYTNRRPLTAVTRKLWQDPWFANAVTMRYNELIEAGLTEYLCAKIDSLADLLEESQTQNYKKWPINKSTLNNIDTYHSYNTYAEYITQLKNFVTQHNAFLTTAFARRNQKVRYLDESASLPFVAESSIHVVLRRTAQAGMWNTVCLPFALTTSEVERVFGEGTQVAHFSSVSDNVLNFNTVASMEAGVPYLVKPTLDVDEPFSFSYATLATSEPKSEEIDGYCFVGVFEPTEIDGDGQNYLIGENDALLKPDQETELKGFRAYIRVPEGAVAKDFAIDGEALAINLTSADEKGGNAIYDLTGRKMRQTLSTDAALPRGIYIKNGKKYIIK